MKNRKSLIIVDVQYDFIPVSEEDHKNNLGGALAVKEGDQIIPVINELLPKFDLVIFTKDWHPNDMDVFASMHKRGKPFKRYKFKTGEDILWPDHCIQNTRGADIHDDINFSLIKGDFYIFKKGMEKNKHPYSGFGAKGLKDFLNKRGVEEVFICGLALDFCVKDTAIDAAMLGFSTVVIEDGTRPINPNINSTLEVFQEAGVKMIESWELLIYNLL